MRARPARCTSAPAAAASARSASSEAHSKLLYDRASIEVRAGNGGDGAASFRREAHVPRGGPDGGDGGRGGDVVLVCRESLRDLRALKRRSLYVAGNGQPGSGALRHGARGPDLLIGVPPGTEAWVEAPGEEGRRWDLIRERQRAVVARGGTGGRGNKHFANPVRQAPHFAERGLAGERNMLALALKLLADVGFIGLPNAGKSSLLRRMTRARPKVASYPFTTLEPALGVLEAHERQLVLADIPGLIEGAAGGAGLGDEFLAHVERTRLLVQLIDVAPELAGAAPLERLLADFAVVEREIALYDERLVALPRLVCLSKIDLLEQEAWREPLSELSAALGERFPVLALSSASGEGVRRLTDELLARVPDSFADLHSEAELQASGADRAGDEPSQGPGPRAGGELDGETAALGGGRLEPIAGEGAELLPEHVLLRPDPSAGFQVRKLREGAYVIEGERAERLLARFDVGNLEARDYVEERLRRWGALSALRTQGFRPGDQLLIGDRKVALAGAAVREEA